MVPMASASGTVEWARAEHALGDELDGHVEACDADQGQRESAGNAARRLDDFAACAQRGFHAREREHREDEGAPQSGSGGMHGRDEIGAVDGARADDYEHGQRDEFERRADGDEARALGGATEVDGGDAAEHADDDRRSYHHGGGLRHRADRHVGECGGDPTAGQHIGEPDEEPGHVAGEAAEGGFDIAVGAAAGGDAAAGFGETDRHRADDDPAGGDGQRCVQAHRAGEGAGHGEDAGADHDVDDAGGEAPGAYGADQAVITAVFGDVSRDVKVAGHVDAGHWT
jgi:hypothetical protein